MLPPPMACRRRIASLAGYEQDTARRSGFPRLWGIAAVVASSAGLLGMQVGPGGGVPPATGGDGRRGGVSVDSYTGGERISVDYREVPFIVSHDATVLLAIPMASQPTSTLRVRAWFEKNFPSPTPVQQQAWPAIAAGKNDAGGRPDRSGKHLPPSCGLLMSWCDKASTDGSGSQQVLYISPPRALSKTTSRRTCRALRGIRAELKAQGVAQSGDPCDGAHRRHHAAGPAEHARSRRIPRHHAGIGLVLLTSLGGRRMLSGVCAP